MFRCTRWISTAVLFCATAMSVAATAQTETASPDSAVVQITPEMAAAAAVAASPLEREVAAVRDSFHARLAELTARYGAATDANAAADAQREIAALKMQLEIDLLGIQLRLARSGATRPRSPNSSSP